MFGYLLACLVLLEKNLEEFFAVPTVHLLRNDRFNCIVLGISRVPSGRRTHPAKNLVADLKINGISLFTIASFTTSVNGQDSKTHNSCPMMLLLDSSGS